MVETEIFKYKLVWQEKENEWNTAFGNAYAIKDGIIVFDGSKGEIILSPCIKWIVK